MDVSKESQSPTPERKALNIYLHSSVRPGKHLCIPDAFFSAPVDHPAPEDEVLSTESCSSINVVATLQAVQPLAIPQRPENPSIDDMAIEDLQVADRSDPS